MVKPVLIPFVISKDVSFVVEIGFENIRFYAKQGKLMDNDNLYTVKSPYQYIDLYDKNGTCLLQYLQNGDRLYLFHQKYPTKVLSRYGNTNWAITDFEFLNGPWENVNSTSTTISSSESTGVTSLTSSDSVFKANDVGRLIRLTVVDSTVKHWQADMDVSQGTIVISDHKYYKSMGEGKTGNVKPSHSEGIMSDGKILFQYQHPGYGVAKITQYISPTHVKADIEGIMPDEIKSGTRYWELGVIYSGGEQPICGTFFRNRFCFMINDGGIPKVYLSCSDDYNNFADKDEGDVLATNAITIPVTSDKYNEGRWLSSSNVLFVGTSSGEFYIDSASSSEALAPDNNKIQLISSVGSRAITPVKIGAHILFVTDNGTSLRDIVYSFTQDSYDPIDLSLYGKHLLTSGITGITYQENPDKILWMTVGDGKLIGLTFSSEQTVQAFHQHDLSGNVGALTVIPNPYLNSDDLWLSVERNGVHTIEYIETHFEINKENAFYVDGGLSIKREIYEQEDDEDTIKDDKKERQEIYLSGLEHLEGKEVVLFVDGSERERQIVKNGTIKAWSDDKYIVAGLPIESSYIPQTLYIQGNNGSGVGDVQRIDHITLMLWKSLGGKVGSSFNDLQDIYFRLTDDKMNESSPLYTGNKKISVSFNTSTIKEKGASLVIYNDSVYPMNILAIAPHFSTSGNGL